MPDQLHLPWQTEPPILTAAQCRAARALIDWKQWQLAKHAGVATSTVADFERGVRQPIANNLTAIRDALARGGVVFIPNGVHT